MKIVDVKISDLIAADYNPRVMSDKDYQDTKASLTKYGLAEPIIVNKRGKRKNVIIGGHQRVKIWQEMGNDTVPVNYYDLSMDDEKELNIRLNKNKGDWDKEKFKYFSKAKLIEWGFDMWDLKEDFDDPREKAEAEKMEIEKMDAFLYEHHDYMVVVFDNFQDFLKVVNMFDLKKVNVSQTDKVKQFGLGRVISSDLFYKKLDKYVEENSSE